ncbi:MAG: ABC transporter substrate-binding protein [Nitrososphaerota archaeon]|jgi:peptide/nickel transport system substrate-binding protein|nr:ABC transporter substrate-binding protein [Nitrososphaerota archaeon]MDG6968325.1 ABC transporter substrate-binding protein [Nitrososphaerota archaeon]MDG6983844.1 ABC transporter substrate-binding protein [Nitrososphaerota archaeon]MDG6987610.1 ABC transporter substrate-binding protein [Nitrososphaerota archaeon]
MVTRKAAYALLFGVLLAVMSGLAPAVVPAASSSGSSYSQSGTLILAEPNCIDSFTQFLTACNPPWYYLQDMFPDNGVPTALGLVHVAVQSYWTSTNGTIWYFRVTPGMTWSDGVQANATDLSWSIQQMYSSFSWGAGSLVPYASLLRGTPQQAVVPVNSSVVEVKLTRPFSLLGSIIGSENTPNFTPYHIWKNWINATTAPGNLFGTLVGVGPYYVSNYHQGDQQLVMLPNPYPTPWGSPANGGHPYFKQIVTELVPSSASLADLLLSGQIDAAPVAPSDVAGLLSNQNIKIATASGTGLWYIEFPATHYPYNMTAFRHALAYAINTQTLVKSALAGYGTTANAAFIPSTSPEFNSSVPTYSYNMSTAQQLLTSIGFKMGSGGFYTLPNGTAFQPPIYVPAEQTPIVLAGTLVVQELQQAGIDAQLRPIAGATMASVWYKGVNMYFENQNFGYPNSELLTDGSFYSYFLASGPEPGQQPFASASTGSEYNSTVAALEASTNPQQTTTYEKNIQGLLASYLPSIPLFYPDFIWAYNSQKVAGWPQSPGSFELPGLVWNLTALATIRPANLSTAATTTVASSTPTSSSTDSYLVAGAAAVVVVAVVAAVAATVLRKKPKT